MKPAAVATLSLQAFRGFRESVSLPLTAGRRRISVCLWGDNGTGKSSFADGVEFFFSTKGTVERLGEKSTENKAGPAALRNAAAPLPTAVTVAFDGGPTVERRVSGSAPQAMPHEVRRIMASVPAPLVLRAAEIRAFVADNTGAERYALLSKWIGLDRLTELLDELAKAERKVVKLNRAEARLEKQKDLLKLTNHALSDWDTPAVLAWVNATLLRGLPREFQVSGPRDLRVLEEKLSERASHDAERIGAKAYTDAAASVSALADRSDAALFRRCERAHARWLDASQALEDLRRSHRASKIRDVALAARAYIESAGDASCPVCTRPFDTSTSREAVLANLDDILKDLASFSSAEKNAAEAWQTLKAEVRALQLALSETSQRIAALPETHAFLSSTVTPLLDASTRWLNAADRDQGPAFEEVSRLFSACAASAPDAADKLRRAADALSSQSTTPWADLMSTVHQLRDIGNRWVEIDREEKALALAAEQFKEVANRIRRRVREHVASVVAGLSDEVRRIYAALRQNDPDSPKLEILVAEERKSVSFEMELFGMPRLVPSGYLSDSQLNSLGLALFLAAIRRFNGEFPFVVLDDIMSSYDAAHHRNLLAVIRKDLGDFQVVLTTHDEAFFKQARAMLDDTGSWQFYQLQPWTLETGVRITGIGTGDGGA